MKYIRPIGRKFKDDVGNNIRINIFKFKRLERRINKVLIEVKNKTYRIKSRRR